MKGGYRFGPGLAVVVLLMAAIPACAASVPDTPLNRARAQMAVQELEITLLTHPSATLALEDWCATHHMADRPVVTARKMTLARPDDVPPAVRADLGVSAAQPVRHRQVRLVCGTHVLSVADNWYVPDRLPAEMNAMLERTDASFGHVVAPLHFSRIRLEFVRLWSPWPGAAPARRLAVPAAIIRQRGVLRDEHGQPFSEVVETYTDQALDFLPAP
ncbi:hypothetical protein SXCC_03187 [Gluconacetobacter sp. SXCC-1]|uniref:Uncharacterized protein n=1 Tax=Komagataeibacter rhaeticus TaxID=215221 RepID=A0A181C817_9PROT|nr:hypothetical protein [Komagataeibacter rhaeticus]ATU73544.1 hypothetical protein CT154_12670 [Komagataeibacter xylinus]EGG76198.1 hypothetical protein SXCC_03187 [Gluconacetobacter sp. SXCC-1]QIP34624.1 hypothetical protein GWK63_03195 [Komagataeibacter rhaeticus]QOC47145.1 hypothetical protein ICJ78_03195 [Komagataeibacter rhaeticus]WPP20517.1 hypothetical protein SCD25_08435 [Komagataeibacter rhaeticus]